MKAVIYSTPKQAILKKLKEIEMDKQEDRKGPEDEATKVSNRSEKFEGTDTEYFKNLYDSDELKDLERKGSHPDGGKSPTKDQPAVEEIKDGKTNK